MSGSPLEPAQWTVGQLRAELIGLPDHTPVVVDVAMDVTGSTYERRPVVGAGYGPDIDPTEDIFTGQEFPLVAGRRHPTDQRITPTADDGPSRTV